MGGGGASMHSSDSMTTQGSDAEYKFFDFYI